MQTPVWDPRTPFGGDKNRCVLLVPGTWCSESLWRSHIEALNQAGCDAYSLDTTGFDSIENATQAVLKNGPPTLSVAGFSSGGYLVFDLLRQAQSRVSRVALISTQASPVDENFEKPQTLAMLEAAKAMPVEDVVENMLPALVADPTRPVFKQLISQMASEVGIDGLENQVTALLGRGDATDLLPTISRPTLVVSSEKDQLIPAQNQQHMASQIPGSNYVRIDGVGHMVPIEDSEKLQALLVDWACAAD